jgi:hypothetical protein
MPEPTVKEGRLPELHLPEVTREDIMRTFSEIRRPDIDLSVEWPKVDLSRIEWTREDLDKAVLGIATAARIVRPAVRSGRLPLALGFLAVASLATFAILSRPSVRDRLAQAAGEARRRAMAARSGGQDLLEVEADVLPGSEVAEAVAIPIEPDAFNGSGPKDVAETLEGTVADPA